MNNVVLTGRVAVDPQLKYTTGNNTPFCTFGVVVGDKPYTSFIPIEIWGNRAEKAAQSVRKGRIVSLNGELKQNQWETEAGGKQSRIVVVAFRVEFWDKTGDEEGGQEGGEGSAAPNLNDVARFFAGDDE